MGDNRDNSSDSRYWGSYAANIIGKPLLIIGLTMHRHRRCSTYVGWRHMVDLVEHFPPRSMEPDFSPDHGYPLN